MSRVAMGSDGGAWAFDPETNMACDFIPQGIGADLIATLDGYSRTEVDQFAAASQHKAQQRKRRDISSARLYLSKIRQVW